MQLAVPFTAFEMLVPKGCRKPRRVEVASTMSVHILELDSAQAPIALVETPTVSGGVDIVSASRDSDEDSCHGPRTYRWYNGHFWVPLSPDAEKSFHDFIADPATLGQRLTQSWRRDAAEVKEAIAQWAVAHVVIDDVPHVKIEEPHYHVKCSTSFHYCSVDLDIEHTTVDEDRPALDRFNVLQTDEALAYANVVHGAFQEHQGSEDAAPTLPATFEILLPQAVRHTFVPSPRTPTRVTIEIKETIRAHFAWAVDFRDSEVQGFRLPDGRRIVPQVGFALFDESTGARTQLTNAEVEEMGFYIEHDRGSSFWQRTAE